MSYRITKKTTGETIVIPDYKRAEIMRQLMLTEEDFLLVCNDTHGVYKAEYIQDKVDY